MTWHFSATTKQMSQQITVEYSFINTSKTVPCCIFSYFYFEAGVYDCILVAFCSDATIVFHALSLDIAVTSDQE